jgi:transcriptional regulator with XRE-family HTH domain
MSIKIESELLAPEEQLILIAHRLRKAREAKGWSQSKLAGKVGKHVNLIAVYENQSRPPTLLTLLRVCQALGVTLAELLDESLPE